ncbi:MAG: alcohol dehydrogenase catalytic domain-containing protein, partial [Armatimonadetes bacterium]|nr:alcohol dehydrogenase catalytic domain-containing protein [Armatimonadota bacterium]MDW8122884.1 alcohol dehydrogenase catalytic domain-containing protein [Armatimonadota bacterium]
MKVAFFKLPGVVELREQPVPEPREGEVLVQVLSCGICGTDAEAFRHHQSDWHRRGHEYSGRIVQVGPKVTAMSEGDLVSGIGSVPCFQCGSCQKGHFSLCSHPIGFGGDAFAEFLCKPAQFFFPIPDLTAEEGALMEPLTVAMDLVRDGNVRSDSLVVLLGAGPIGLMTIPLAKQQGAQVLVIHPYASKRRWRLALQWGADAVFHPDKEDVVENIRNIAPEGVDSVLVTIKPSIGIPVAVDMCKVGGTI